MKKSTLTLCLLSAFLLTSFLACKKDTEAPDSPKYTTPNLPAEHYNYANNPLPDHFSEVAFFDNTPADNQISDAGATLGRVLFYDAKLSLNNTTACASCHLQKNGFADPAQFSIGFEGKKTKRNSISLVNPRFSTTFFWDSRTTVLEDQVLEPVLNHIEMGLEDMDDLAKKLSRVDYYPSLFEDAFGTQDITPERIAKSMAQFLRALECKNSKFDQGYETNHANYTAQELQGKELFFSQETQCSNCHRSINFYYGSSVNIGLDLDYSDEGEGEGRFRIPSLRNVGLSAPYMHDGRFTSLEEVVDHYNSGVKAHNNLDWRLRDDNGEPIRLNLSTTEKEALVAFLETLTDHDFVTNPMYSDPF